MILKVKQKIIIIDDDRRDLLAFKWYVNQQGYAARRAIQGRGQ
jgi:hypothetical protein